MMAEASLSWRTGGVDYVGAGEAVVEPAGVFRELMCSATVVVKAMTSWRDFGLRFR